MAIILAGLVSCKSDPDTILKKAESAHAGLHSVVLEASFMRETTLDNAVYKDNIKLFLVRNGSDKLFPFKIRIDRKNRSSSYFNDSYTSLRHDRRECLLVANGNGGHLYIDRKLFTSYLDDIAALKPLFPRNGSGRTIVRYAGAANVFGIKCDAIEIKTSESASGRDYFYIYYIGRKDNLVRKVKMSYYRGIDEGFTRRNKVSIVKTFNYINIDQDISDEIFSIKAPNAYKLIRFKPKESLALLRKGMAAPNWALLDSRGNEITLKSLRPNLALISFCNLEDEWCMMSLSCQKEIYKTFKDSAFTMVSISCNEKEDANIKRFKRINRLKFSILANGDNVADKYRVSRYPTFYLIDRRGRIVYSGAGYRNDLKEFLAAKILNKL